MKVPYIFAPQSFAIGFYKVFIHLTTFFFVCVLLPGAHALVLCQIYTPHIRWLFLILVLLDLVLKSVAQYVYPLTHFHL